MPKPRLVSVGRSVSILTYGSSRPKTAPGDTSWTGSCIDGLTLEALRECAEPRTQARDRTVAQSTGGAVYRGRPRRRGRIVGHSLRAPQGKEIARRAAIKTVIDVGEVVNPLHRMTDRRVDQQQDALEYRDRHAGCLCGDHHGFTGRIVEYPLAQTLRNIDQAFEFAGELADPPLQRGDVEPSIDVLATFGSSLNFLTGNGRDQRQQPAPFRRRGCEKCLTDFRRCEGKLPYLGCGIGRRRYRCAFPIGQVLMAQVLMAQVLMAQVL